MFIDNNATMFIVQNPFQHGKTKHIDLRHHFLRDCAERGLVHLERIDTELNLADLFTKPLDSGRFNFLTETLGILNLEPEEP